MKVDRQHILSEIKRIAKSNNGRPPGRQKFEKETGIKMFDWYPDYWIQWGDALLEAGFSPNKMQEAFPENDLLGKYAEFIRELGHFPVDGEVRRKEKQDLSFPTHTTWRKRFGVKKELRAKIVNFCESRGGWDDVIKICAASSEADEELASSNKKNDQKETDIVLGVVYLMKSGRYFKIGRSTSVGRREYELSIQLPEKVNVVHTINTDDPVGIEAYWHNRFRERRKNGEWFELTLEDVKAFKRRKYQ